jgi:hypothetical protein
VGTKEMTFPEFRTDSEKLCIFLTPPGSFRGLGRKVVLEAMNLPSQSPKGSRRRQVAYQNQIYLVKKILMG